MDHHSTTPVAVGVRHPAAQPSSWTTPWVEAAKQQHQKGCSGYTIYNLTCEWLLPYLPPTRSKRGLCHLNGRQSECLHWSNPGKWFGLDTKPSRAWARAPKSAAGRRLHFFRTQMCDGEKWRRSRKVKPSQNPAGAKRGELATKPHFPGLPNEPVSAFWDPTLHSLPGTP